MRPLHRVVHGLLFPSSSESDGLTLPRNNRHLTEQTSWMITDEGAEFMSLMTWAEMMV